MAFALRHAALLILARVVPVCSTAPSMGQTIVSQTLMPRLFSIGVSVNLKNTNQSLQSGYIPSTQPKLIFGQKFVRFLALVREFRVKISIR